MSLRNRKSKLNALLKSECVYNISYILLCLSVVFTIYAYNVQDLTTYDLSMATLIFSCVLHIRIVSDRNIEITELILFITGKNLYDEILGVQNEFFIAEYIIFVMLIIRLLLRLRK